MGALYYQNKRNWILLNVFPCFLEPSVELLSEEVELKEGCQAGELCATLREPFYLENALD